MSRFVAFRRERAVGIRGFCFPMCGHNLNLQRRALVVCVSGEVGGRVADIGLEQFHGSAEHLILFIERSSGPEVEKCESIGVFVCDWESRV